MHADDEKSGRHGPKSVSDAKRGCERINTTRDLAGQSERLSFGVTPEETSPHQVERPELDPRVLMAAERTLLAWIRTGVAMMGFGFVVARFGVFLREMAAAGSINMPKHGGISPYVGTGLLIAGAVCIAIATIDYLQFLRTYERGEPTRPKRLSLATVLAGLLSIAGVGLAVYLLSV